MSFPLCQCQILVFLFLAVFSFESRNINRRMSPPVGNDRSCHCFLLFCSQIYLEYRSEQTVITLHLTLKVFMYVKDIDFKHFWQTNLSDRITVLLPLIMHFCHSINNLIIYFLRNVFRRETLGHEQRGNVPRPSCAGYRILHICACVIPCFQH